MEEGRKKGVINKYLLTVFYTIKNIKHTYNNNLSVAVI